MSTVWERRRKRWALYKDAQAAAASAPHVDAAEFAAARREAVEDRGRDFVEAQKAVRS